MSDCSGLCVATPDQCTETVKGIVSSVVYLVVEIAAAATGDIDIMGIIKSIGQVAIDLAAGLCPVPTAEA